MRRQDDKPEESGPGISCYHGRENRASCTPAKSLIRFESQKFRVCESRNDLCKTLHEAHTSTSKASPRLYPKTRQDTDEVYKLPIRAVQVKDGRVFSSPEFVVNDCWKATSGEIPVKLVELFRETNPEDQDVTVRITKRKVGTENSEKLSKTKEFHLLSEVQKARILTIVEDAIKKLSKSDLNDIVQETRERCPENPSVSPADRTVEKYVCKKFLLPWVLMKVIELVLCHVIQLAFLANDSYFYRKRDFLPVVVTYYLTLVVVVVSMVVHVSCCSYFGTLNPCYFMCGVSLSIVTLSTVLGILIMLCSMEFYGTFREICVLVLLGAFLCAIIVELSVCYVQVKNFWNRARHSALCLP